MTGEGWYTTTSRSYATISHEVGTPSAVYEGAAQGGAVACKDVLVDGLVA